VGEWGAEPRKARLTEMQLPPGLFKLGVEPVPRYRRDESLIAKSSRRCFESWASIDSIERPSVRSKAAARSCFSSIGAEHPRMWMPGFVRAEPLQRARFPAGVERAAVALEWPKDAKDKQTA